TNVFAELDKDHNGRVDATELAAWLQQPPDVELRLAFPAPLAAPIEFKLNTPRGPIRFQGEQSEATVQSERAAWTKADSSLREQLAKLGMADVDAAMKALAPLAACRVTVSLLDQGGGLFELLDRNSDGQLSPRELLEAARLLQTHARADGKM